MKFEGSFKNKDAQNIIYRAFIPDSPKAVVVLAHGLGEHSMKYRYFGDMLYSAGIAAFLYDQRGHGRSQGRRVCIGDFGDYVSDLRQMAAIAKVEALCGKAFIVGLSMGGLLALEYAIRYRDDKDAIRGVVVSAPALKLKSPPSGIEKGIVGLIALLMPRLTTPNRIPFEWLTHDKDLIKDTKEDKLSQRVISFGLYAEMIKAMRFVSENIGMLDVPALFIQGTDDKVVDMAGVREIFDRIPVKDKELALYEGMYHELLRETRREEIIGKIADWILKRAGER
ncbi:MAG: lysophospholipase [Candidatus Omnitrophica bacterium]|nr:lysophospholipase [Candidatus Omnitrophota bacterium]MDD5737053.1 lysophospholipase [Candidatus Omnitrophota bacterium]